VINPDGLLPTLAPLEANKLVAATAETATNSKAEFLQPSEAFSSGPRSHTCANRPRS